MVSPPRHGGQTTLAVIVGTDALLAARPASPIQVAHACHALGYELVVPVSWGDELVAAECARRLAARDGAPAILCACPNVAARVLGPGHDLAPYVIECAPPAVAAARYLRSVLDGSTLRITYLGACPAAKDDAIDATIPPIEFLGMLFERGMLLAEQPKVFDSVLPPDRRRWWSLPGGLPDQAALWREHIPYTVAQLVDDDVAAELAQHILAHERELLDVAPRVGCPCCGAREDVAVTRAREMVTAFEPPRASAPVLDGRVAMSLAPPFWARPLADARERGEPNEGALALPTVTRRVTPVGLPAEVPLAARRRRGRAARISTRRGQVPLAQMPDGRRLPRAYVMRRPRESGSGEEKPWASLPSLPSKSWVVL